MVDLRQHLKSHTALCLAAIFIVISTWIGLVIWGRVAGPTVDATGIVTVVEYVDGNIGKWTNETPNQSGPRGADIDDLR